MADEQDDAQKTEEPSSKKLEDAYRKGQAPRSQEVKTWFMLLAATIAFALFAGSSARAISNHLYGYFAHAHQMPVDGGSLLNDARAMGLTILLALSLPVLMLIAGAFGGSLVQGKIVFTAEKIKPQLSKISPLKGLKRMFSVQSVAELGKSVAKLVVIGATCAILLWPERGYLIDVLTMSPAAVLSITKVMAIKLAVAVVAIMTVVALLDYALQRQQFMKQMRMTKQEVKDEHKQLEGDPQIKARIRQVRAQRARQRVAQAVPESDVVITNPTHYAIALSYKHGEMAVPKLKAKGVDHLAARIRELAKEHDIPIVENPPLARAIYAGVEIDQDIPAEHYKAVAEVIAYVLRLKGQLPPARK